VLHMVTSAAFILVVCTPVRVHASKSLSQRMTNGADAKGRIGLLDYTDLAQRHESGLANCAGDASLLSTGRAFPNSI
jgi:hypothetical protein